MIPQEKVREARRTPREQLEDKQAIEGLKILKQVYLEKDNSEGMWSVTLNCIQAGIDALMSKDYVLSDDELRELLESLKKEDNGARDAAGILENCLQVNHETIDNVFKALRGRVPRGLSVEEIEKIAFIYLAKSDLGLTLYDIASRADGKPITLSPEDRFFAQHISCILTKTSKGIAQAVYDAQTGKE